MASTPAPGEILCPDPSAHPHGQHIHDSASKAALLAAGGEGRKSTSSDNIFSEDGKLTSSNRAQSLKYAKPQDLPSFPSRGGTSSAAFAAATLAKDHQMKELWQYEQSAVGTSAAAQAQRKGAHLDLWEPSPSATGNSAAAIAMKTKGLSPEIDRGYTDTGRNNSLMAATKVSASHGGQRAGSVPAAGAPRYPDEQNASKNALNAATVSNRMAPDGWDSEANQAARIKNLGGRMDRDMFGEHPPVEPELEEQRHQAALRASAVSMAKSMYEYQNRAGTPTETSSVSGGAGAGAEVAHRRNRSSMSQPDIKEEAMKYINLQDAAHKMAQERLARLDKEMADNRYREYYGTEPSPRKSRLSMRRKPRTASEGENASDSDDDTRQARRIRSQMSQLTTASNTVDVKQRQADRAKLMAAAEKRVHARMHDMDEKVFAETGKVSQSMMDEWEAKARAKAEEQKAEREAAAPKGKVAIGGGKFMDQAEIEAIAAARLKPTLEEIDSTAQKMRERDVEMKRLEDARETAVMEQKMKEDQQKVEFKRVKEQDKLKQRQHEAEMQKKEAELKRIKDQQKMEEKAREQHQAAEFRRIKEQDKANARREKEERKAAERREKEEAKARRYEEKRKSREVRRDEVAVASGSAALGDVAERVREDKQREENREVEGTVAAGTALEEVAERVKREKERDEEQHRESVEMAGVAIGEIAGRVKSNQEQEEKRKSKEQRRSSAAGAAGGDTLAEIAERLKGQKGVNEQVLEEGHGTEVASASAIAGAAGVAAYGTSDSRAVDSDPANIVDPRVRAEPQLEQARSTESDTGPAPNTIGPHSSDIMNIIDPRVKPQPELQKAEVKNPETGPAPNTIGPWKSDIANVLDFGTKPQPELQKSSEPATSGPWKSDIANKLDPSVNADDPTATQTRSVQQASVPAEPAQKETVPATPGPHRTTIANFLDPDTSGSTKYDQPEKDQESTNAAALLASAVGAGAVAVGAGAAVVPTDRGGDEQLGATTTQEKPAQEPKPTQAKRVEEPQRSSSGKGMLSRFTNKFKRREDEKREPGSLSSAKKESAQPQEDTKVVAVPTAAAAPSSEKQVVEEEDDVDDVDRSAAAEAMIGAGVAGSATAAVTSTGEEKEVTKDDVSSLSTEDEDEAEDLEKYETTAEHSGHHNFASPSPTDEREDRKRLNLERHISTIDTSSGTSEGTSDDAELSDSDHEDDGDRGRTGRIVETSEAPVATEASATTEEQEARDEHLQAQKGAYAHAGKGGITTEQELESRFATYELNDPNAERTHQMEEQIRRVEAEKAQYYNAPVNEPAAEQKEEKEGLLQKILHPFGGGGEKEEGTSREPTQTSAAPVAAPVRERSRSPVSPIQPEDEITTEKESVAHEEPSPVVTTGPESQTISPQTSTTSPGTESPSSSQPAKERKGGIKGIFSKLTSKPEHKLHKRGDTREDVPPPGGAAESVHSEGAGSGSFVGGAKLAGGDDTTVSSTTGTAEQEGGADGTVGELHVGRPPVTGVGSSTREDSPSSFRRHDEDPADPDDVSSSGAEEEEVKQGRAGRLARKLGLTRGRGKVVAADAPAGTTATATRPRAESGEQFEEARDQFDESLAPPAAFAGKSKIEQSPARETRFQEEF